MNKEELREFQLAQLPLLDEIDRISKELNLVYYLIGGTLLGAVRNSGFIPWDPDMDIAMPRQDYEKLKCYFKTYKSDVFFYEDYDSEKYHNSTHAILRIKGTTVIFKRLSGVGKKISNNGLFLDIFPLDKSPMDIKKRTKQIRKILRIKRILYYKEAQIYDRKKKIKNMFKKLISLFLSVISYKSLGKKLTKVETKYNEENSDYLVSMSSHYSYEKQLINKDVYGVPQKIIFEGKEYSAPNDIDAYLTKIYGNYLKLPPEEKRFLGIDEIIFVDNRKQ